jgi:zinc transporter ZupT
MDTTEDSHSSSPPVAFAITLAAGAATWVGALVVFIPVIVQKTSARVFAAALGLSAGFLAYISTIKIFVESYENFVSSGFIGRKSLYLYNHLILRRSCGLKGQSEYVHKMFV